MPSLFTLLPILSLTTAALAGVLPRDASDSSVDGSTHTGKITYYNTEGGTGACGTTLSDSDAICALSTTLYDQYTQNGNPNDNSLCGKQIQITMDDGSTATVTVADRCEACAQWDLDLTPTTFTSIVSGGLDVGRTTASWKFIS